VILGAFRQAVNRFSRQNIFIPGACILVICPESVFSSDAILEIDRGRTPAGIYHAVQSRRIAGHQAFGQDKDDQTQDTGQGQLPDTGECFIGSVIGAGRLF